MEIILEKSGLKAVKVGISEFKKTKFLQIMEMWRVDPMIVPKEWNPSKKNVSINSHNIEEFVEFIKKNGDEIIKQVKGNQS